jgi:ferredoxin
VADAEFVVVLARSGREFRVPVTKTILEVLEENGIEVPNSCRQGLCGTCETRVIAGTPDHRDSILPHDPGERVTMTVCCSRSLSERLVLDL